MRWLAHIQRSMLGVIFVLNGLNGFIHLHPPILFKTAVAQQYMSVMQATPYGHVLFALQLICGILLVARFFVPFALVVLAAYLFNIYMFHLFLDRTFSPLALIVTVLWGFTMSNYRSAFRSILIPRFPETFTNV